MYIQGVRLNGNVGQQIKEQVQVEAAKRAAKMKAPQWGVVQNEIEWKEMLRTCKNKSIADRRRLMLDMWDGRWTNKNYLTSAGNRKRHVVCATQRKKHWNI